MKRAAAVTLVMLLLLTALPTVRADRSDPFKLLGLEYYRDWDSVGEISNLTMHGLIEFARNNVSDESQYRDVMRLIAALHTYESTRIALIDAGRFYIAGSRVESPFYDPYRGFDVRWTPMTAKTPDGTLRAAFMVYTCGVHRPFNPVAGLDHYPAQFLSRAFDRGAYLFNGTYVPYRCTWEISEKPGTVPSGAVLYNQTSGWVSVHGGEDYSVSITYRCGLGQWQNGAWMSGEDIKNYIAFLYTWAYEDFQGDPYYEPKLELAENLSNIVGFSFNGSSYTVYLRVREPLVDDLLASKYLFYPQLPWELYWAMGELVANEERYGVYGTNYVFIPEELSSWGYPENDYPVDLFDNKSLEDLDRVIVKLMAGKGPDIPGIDWRKAFVRFILDRTFHSIYGHFLVGNGPYVFAEAVPESIFYRMERFEGWRDVVGDILPAEGSAGTIYCVGALYAEGLIEKVAAGEYDVFLEGYSTDHYQKLLGYAKEGKIKLYRASDGVHGAVLNPADENGLPVITDEYGKPHFNPFAIREVRLALNYIINRSELASEIRGAVPAFDRLGPFHPGEGIVGNVYGAFNLTPGGDPDCGMALFERGMEKARLMLNGTNHTLERINGTWYFDGRKVEIILAVEERNPRYREPHTLEVGNYLRRVFQRLGFEVRLEYWDIYYMYGWISKDEGAWHVYVMRSWPPSSHWTARPHFVPWSFIDVPSEATVGELLRHISEG